MQTLGYYNGKFGELSEMSVPMCDRACYFGDGVYDATYSRNHIIWDLDKHIDRFYNSAALLRIEISQSKQEMKDILNDMVSKMDGDGNCFVYWQATRGTGPRNHKFSGMKANIWIMLTPSEIQPLDKTLKLITVEDTRFLHCNIKTLNLIPSVMAAQKADEAGCDEVIFHRHGRVTECAHSNISIIKDGIFVTAPTDHMILPGIARANIIAKCKELGYGVDETEYTVDDLMNADEVILSSSGSLAMRVTEVDGKPVGGKAGAMLKELQDALLADFLAYTDKK